MFNINQAALPRKAVSKEAKERHRKQIQNKKHSIDRRILEKKKIVLGLKEERFKMNKVRFLNNLRQRKMWLKLMTVMKFATNLISLYNNYESSPRRLGKPIFVTS